ncbi:tRNA lysidine(34) synthetase TilS [Salinisphaera sp. SPP-AMP-43]|uniref:tRNA lysidine(34) synthetase TilS n=1 Tax=Salinisphaera sp. SPP-AMP-43 TaxID=3121288 RepID=UPI003C6E12A7
MNDPARALAVLPEDTRGLVVAFSGGHDSSALLQALAEAAHPVPLRAVHVCHQIETEADSWAAHCERVCAARGIQLRRIDVEVDTRGKGLEAAARVARYRALAEQIEAGEVLVCAHHAEDQAETFLLQALRGSGVAGLAGMPSLSPCGAGRLWRPWLKIERAAITRLARARGLDWIEDATNLDPRRARGFVREHVWPALSQGWPAAAQTLSRSAAWAADAAAAVDTLAGIDLHRVRAVDDSLRLAELAVLTEARAAEVLRRWLREGGHDVPDHRHIEQIRRISQAREHSGPRVGFVDTEVRRFDARLFAMSRLAVPPMPGQTLAWSAPDGLSLPSGCGRLRLAGRAPADWPNDLTVCFRAGGEKLARANGSRQALAEWLRAARVPPWVRERLPLIYAGRVLIAIPGLWGHPALADWFRGERPDFIWEHGLVGAPIGAME